MEDNEGGANQQDILEDTGHGKNDSGSLANLRSWASQQHDKELSGHGLQIITYQEDNRHVQEEGHKGIRKQREKTDVVDVAHGHAGGLNKQGDHTVDYGARRSVVVQRHQRVHLEFGGAQHALDHDEAKSLKDDTAALVYIDGQSGECYSIGPTHKASTYTGIRSSQT